MLETREAEVGEPVAMLLQGISHHCLAPGPVSWRQSEVRQTGNVKDGRHLTLCQLGIIIVAENDVRGVREALQRKSQNNKI